MTMIKILAWIVIVIIGGQLLNVTMTSGFGHGAGLDTFLSAIGNPWQMMINTDLVAGLLFSIGWMLYRERHAPLPQRIAWAWTAAWWGNIVVAAYLLRLSGRPGQTLSNLLQGDQVETRPPLAAAPRMLALAAAVLLASYLVRELLRPGLTLIGMVGYFAGLAPLILSLALIATAASARPLNEQNR